MKTIKDYTAELNDKQLRLLYFQAMIGIHAQHGELDEETQRELIRLEKAGYEDTMAEIYWDLEQMYNADHIHISYQDADQLFAWAFSQYPNIRELIILDIWG